MKILGVLLASICALTLVAAQPSLVAHPTDAPETYILECIADADVYEWIIDDATVTTAGNTIAYTFPPDKQQRITCKVGDEEASIVIAPVVLLFDTPKEAEPAITPPSYAGKYDHIISSEGANIAVYRRDSDEGAPPEQYGIGASIPDPIPTGSTTPTLWMASALFALVLLILGGYVITTGTKKPSQKNAHNS